MSSKSEIEKIKQLREITGVGFKDCKAAIDETKGDIYKAIDQWVINRNMSYKDLTKKNKQSKIGYIL